MRTMLTLGATLVATLAAFRPSLAPAEDLALASLELGGAVTSLELGRSLTPLELGIVTEHNLARTDPRAYADYLREFREFFDGNLIRIPGQTAAVLTREGRGAVDEAIDFLMAVDPIQSLTTSEGMSRGAADHVRDQGPAGGTGHDGSDGSTPGERIDRHGFWNMIFAENLAYGPDRALDVVMGLIIDDGVPDRGHRTNIFDPRLRIIGVACGPHEVYRSMCVMDYAGEFTEGSP
jgi:uncharacterized protein YkwD